MDKKETMSDEVSNILNKNTLRRRSSVFRRKSILLDDLHKEQEINEIKTLDEHKSSNQEDQEEQKEQPEQKEQTEQKDEEIVQKLKELENLDDFEELENLEGQDNKEDPYEEHLEELFNLSAYVKKMKGEMQDWKNMSKERKAEYERVTKELTRINESGQEADMGVLTEKELDFLEGRPNITDIADKVQEIIDSAVKSVVLNQQCARRFHYLNALMEKKLEEATQQVVSMMEY